MGPRGLGWGSSRSGSVLECSPPALRPLCVEKETVTKADSNVPIPTDQGSPSRFRV